MQEWPIHLPNKAVDAAHLAIIAVYKTPSKFINKQTIRRTTNPGHEEPVSEDGLGVKNTKRKRNKTLKCNKRTCGSQLGGRGKHVSVRACQGLVIRKDLGAEEKNGRFS